MLSLTTGALAVPADKRTALRPDREVATVLREHVVSIADGDTLTILDADKAQHKIRFAGIDAPEKSQPLGTKAREALAGKGTASPGSIAAEAALAHRVF